MTIYTAQHAWKSFQDLQEDSGSSVIFLKTHWGSSDLPEDPRAFLDLQEDHWRRSFPEIFLKLPGKLWIFGDLPGFSTIFLQAQDLPKDYRIFHWRSQGRSWDLQGRSDLRWIFLKIGFSGRSTGASVIQELQWVFLSWIFLKIPEPPRSNLSGRSPKILERFSGRPTEAPIYAHIFNTTHNYGAGLQSAHMICIYALYIPCVTTCTH